MNVKQLLVKLIEIQSQLLPLDSWKNVYYLHNFCNGKMFELWHSARRLATLKSSIFSFSLKRNEGSDCMSETFVRIVFRSSFILKGPAQYFVALSICISVFINIYICMSSSERFLPLKMTSFLARCTYWASEQWESSFFWHEQKLLEEKLYRVNHK